MNNFVQPGKTITLPAPYDVKSGQGLLVGLIFAIALFDALQGEPVEAVTEGVFDLTRATGANTDYAIGARIYWDNTNRRTTKTATDNTLIGVAIKTAAVGDATGRIRLNGSF